MLEPPTCSTSPLALSEEQLGGAGVGRAGVVVVLGELGAAPWHGALSCSSAILALGICLGSAGFAAWQESWRLLWERFLLSPKFQGGFLPHERTVGFVLSLVFGVVEGPCCAYWSPALFFHGNWE